MAEGAALEAPFSAGTTALEKNYPAVVVNDGKVKGAVVHDHGGVVLLQGSGPGAEGGLQGGALRHRHDLTSAPAARRGEAEGDVVGSCGQVEGVRDLARAQRRAGRLAVVSE